MSSPCDDKGAGFGTRAIHAGFRPDAYGAVMTPIYHASTYAWPNLDDRGPYAYGRSDNPNRQELERCVAALEGARHGIAFASGVAALTAVLQLLPAGAHIVAGHDIYGGTWRVMTGLLARYAIEVTFVDAADIEAVRDAMRPTTKLLWLESPTNPTLKVVDLVALCEAARKKGVTSVVDNTFLTPFYQNPLALGADIVVHSTTKYLNGHSDVIGGVVVVDDQELAEQLRFVQRAAGAIPSPADCSQVVRGIKTLHLRMPRHSENALTLCDALVGDARVRNLRYPHHPTHPQHALATRQARGSGGMVSFDIAADRDTTTRFLSGMRYVQLAESLGGVESLVAHPASMSHAAMSATERAALGISETTVRLSVGVEDADDIVADILSALQEAFRGQ